MNIFFIAILFYVNRHAFGESQCSTFNVKEAISEKMVRLEYKIDLVQSEFPDIRQDMQSAVKQITDLQATIQVELNDMKKQLTNQLDKIPAKVNDMLKDTQDVLEQKERQITSDLHNVYKYFLANISNFITTPIVSFKATGLKNRNPARNEVLVFPDVMYNAGDMYNADDGTFTAPVSGLYIFTAQLCSKSGHLAAAKLMIDETELGRLMEHYNEKGFPPCNTADAIGYMDNGSKAYVRIIQSSANLQMDAHKTISFSGALLNKG